MHGHVNVKSFQCIVTQHSTSVRQSHCHFNDIYLGMFTLSTKCRILRHGTRCLVQTQTELTTVVTSFFVSFQNRSYEISFRIPPKMALKRILLWGKYSVAKFRIARASRHCAE
jgi:hypothetical protein